MQNCDLLITDIRMPGKEWYRASIRSQTYLPLAAGSCNEQFVKGRLNPAAMGAFKTSHFEEMIILCLILQDKSNKEIARILHRSVRTVEVHRSHIMHKLDVDSVVDLAKRAAIMGLDNTI